MIAPAGEDMARESCPETGETPDIRWMKMLQEYLPRYEVELPFNPRVLNVGCGNSVTWNYLGLSIYLGSLGLGVPYYVGVDLREEAFTKAKKIMGDLVHFVVGDAQYLTDLVSGIYQLAVFEHPTLTTSPDGPKIWRKIFQETAKLMDPQGVLILTSFWLYDHIPAQVALDRARFRILYSGRNRFPGRRFDTAENGESLRYDKYVLVAKKGMPETAC
jgi:SAM-dependent methyltransferase